MDSSDNKTFVLNLKADSVPESIEVTIQDTSDGQPFYSCQIDGSEVQLRKDDDKWEVMWGELNDETLAALGAAIDEHIIKKGE